MDREGIIDLVKALNQWMYEHEGRNDRKPRWIPSMQGGGRNVMISCPFARIVDSQGRPAGGHKHIIDKRPGLGILPATQAPSSWNCFVCGRRGGNLTSFISQLEEELNLPSLTELRKWVLDKEVRTIQSVIEAMPKSLDLLRTTDNRLPVLDAGALSSYQGRVPQYALNRGLSIETCDMWDLGYDPEQDRLVIPAYGLTGELHGAWGRAVRPNQDPPYLRYGEFKPHAMLFGANKCKQMCPVVVVEGQMDAIKLWQEKTVFKCGTGGAVAISGGELSKDQAKLLNRYWTEAILFFDNDEGGLTKTVRAAYRLHKTMPTSVCRYPDYIGEGMDPAVLPNDVVMSMIKTRVPASLWLLEHQDLVSQLQRKEAQHA